MKVVWTPRAIERAGEIAKFISHDNPKAAEEWVAGVFTAVDRLSEHPYSGPMVRELGREEIRQITYRSYRIIYKISKTGVGILSVRHFRRQFDPGEAT